MKIILERMLHFAAHLQSHMSLHLADEMELSSRLIKEGEETSDKPP